MAVHRIESRQRPLTASASRARACLGSSLIAALKSTAVFFDLARQLRTVGREDPAPAKTNRSNGHAEPEGTVAANARSAVVVPMPKSSVKGAARTGAKARKAEGVRIAVPEAQAEDKTDRKSENKGR